MTQASRRRVPAIVAVANVAVATVAMTGCGGGNADIVAPPTQPPTASTSASPSATGSATAGTQHATVTPDKGLSSRQTVHVLGRGFTPGALLVVTQCAAKGRQTGPGDCNLAGMVPVTSGTDGTVRLDFTVVKGPFGANKIVCSRTQPCLVSVTQASLSPTEEADAPISFR